MIAIIRAWDAPFKGDAADHLLATIPMYLEEGGRPHANIVNSSGTGKSRMVDEVAKKSLRCQCVCVKMGTEVLRFFSLFRLRSYVLILIGCPPPDIALRGYIYSIARRYSRAEKIRAELANLLCSVFAVLHRRLEAIAHGDYPQVALRTACQ
jgi:hypothetical protein